MYKMDISLFGYKLNVEILILIGVIYLILIGHTVCGCSRFSMSESFDTIAQPSETSIGIPEPAGHVGVAKTKGIVQAKEGFVGANTNHGESASFDLNSSSELDTSSWGYPNMTVVPGEPLNPAVKQFLERKQQTLPLPEGEMDYFANTEFKPECCPNSYSNSSGCACMTSQDYNYLITRGGNNQPYSEY